MITIHHRHAESAAPGLAAVLLAGWLGVATAGEDSRDIPGRNVAHWTRACGTEVAGAIPIVRRQIGSPVAASVAADAAKSTWLPRTPAAPTEGVALASFNEDDSSVAADAATTAEAVPAQPVSTAEAPQSSRRFANPFASRQSPPPLPTLPPPNSTVDQTSSRRGFVPPTAPGFPQVSGWIQFTQPNEISRDQFAPDSGLPNTAAPPGIEQPALPVVAPNREPVGASSPAPAAPAPLTLRSLPPPRLALPPRQQPVSQSESPQFAEVVSSPRNEQPLPRPETAIPQNAPLENNRSRGSSLADFVPPRQPPPVTPLTLHPTEPARPPLPMQTTALPAQPLPREPAIPGPTLLAHAVGPQPSTLAARHVPITLDVGSFHRLYFKEPVSRIDVADRRVCDVIAQPDRAVDFVARRSGQTQITIQFTTGSLPLLYAVRVGSGVAPGSESAHDGHLQELLAELFPHGNITIQAGGSSLVVHGRARDNAEALRIISFVRSVRLVPVVDKLQIRP